MRRLLSVDLETTGLYAGYNEIWEITAILFEDEKFEIIDSFTKRIKPIHQTRWSEEALKIYQYDSNQKECVEYNTVTARANFKAWLDSHDVEKILIVGNNITFDIGFLKEWLQDEYDTYFLYYPYDTKSICEYLIRTNVLSSTSSKLITMLDYFNLPHKPHNSYSDCKGVIELLKMLYSVKITCQ